MKKRMIALLLCLPMLLCLAVTAFATDRNGIYVRDENFCLTQSEIRFFETQAESLSDALGIDILYYNTSYLDVDLFAQNMNFGKRDDQILLLEADGQRQILLFGTAKGLTSQDVQRLEQAFDDHPDYPDNVAAYFATAETLINEKKAAQELPELPKQRSRLVDNAHLLDAAERAYLLQKLDEISLRQQLDIVVVTVGGLNGKSPMEYADDFFDYNGYGYGPNHDGILLLVSMEERDWWISTTGYGITAFTDAGLEYIADRVVPKLSRQRYCKAFEVFAEDCDQFITQARTGEPYDGNQMPKEPFRLGLCLFISVLIGLFTAGCVVWKLKEQLTTVHLQSGAKHYSVSVTPRLTVNNETYLYSTMSSHPIPKFSQSNRSSGGSGGFSIGSTVHRSSSGRFHGGRGGKF